MFTAVSFRILVLVRVPTLSKVSTRICFCAFASDFFSFLVDERRQKAVFELEVLLSDRFVNQIRVCFFFFRYLFRILDRSCANFVAKIRIAHIWTQYSVFSPSELWSFSNHDFLYSPGNLPRIFRCEVLLCRKLSRSKDTISDFHRSLLSYSESLLGYIYISLNRVFRQGFQILLLLITSYFFCIVTAKFSLAAAESSKTDISVVKTCPESTS